MKIARIVYPITSLGPGERIIIYTAGCRHMCKNCIARNLWTFKKKFEKSIIDILMYIADIYLQDSNIGVTITGGDPFYQNELEELVDGIKKIGVKDLLVYTGYKYSYLVKKEKFSKTLSNIDVLIDGKYVDELNNNQTLRGSENQKIIFLNKMIKDKYTEYLKEERKIIEVDYGGIKEYYGIKNR